MVDCPLTSARAAVALGLHHDDETEVTRVHAHAPHDGDAGLGERSEPSQM